MFEEDVSKEMAPYVSLYRDFITSVIMRRHTAPPSEQVVWEKVLTSRHMYGDMRGMCIDSMTNRIWVYADYMVTQVAKTNAVAARSNNPSVANRYCRCNSPTAATAKD